MSETSLQWKMPSPIGPLFLVASEKGLQGILWKAIEVKFVKSLRGNSKSEKTLLKTIQQLNEYFAGRRQIFDIPFDIKGTEFQNKVWQQLSRIPYGKTCSYKDIATKLKSNAVRAVGTANGRNPISIIVPCHRVITSGGKLGGYAGGQNRKTKLLELEQAI
ncbi:MAG: methylated-DNA--[protein]-cysteine S-methyltransferase [Bdellovibrio sp.]|nr:methylated-DNA--[protein]-cysteine S-methyltransferase [Bdellovibrio sp.]